MTESDPTSEGLFASARRLLDTGLATVQNRLELFSVELKEEKTRLIELFLWTGVALFFGVMALTAVTVAVVYLFWESARGYVLVGFCLIYSTAAVWSAVKLRSKIRNVAMPFADSLSEIKKDRACLQPPS